MTGAKNTYSTVGQTVSRRLYRARQARGLSLRQAAGLMHMSYQTVATMESGMSGLTIPRLEVAAKVYDVPYSWLVGVAAESEGGL